MLLLATWSEGTFFPTSLASASDLLGASSLRLANARRQHYSKWPGSTESGSRSCLTAVPHELFRRCCTRAWKILLILFISQIAAAAALEAGFAHAVREVRAEAAALVTSLVDSIEKKEVRATRLADAYGEPAPHPGAQAIPASHTGGSEFEYFAGTSNDRRSCSNQNCSGEPSNSAASIQRRCQVLCQVFRACVNQGQRVTRTSVNRSDTKFVHVGKAGHSP